MAATSYGGIVEGTMDHFRFSDGAERELARILDDAAPRVRLQLESLIDSYNDWYGLGRTFTKTERANAKRAARDVRQDLITFKRDLEQLTRTIAAIARRERTRRALEWSGLSELVQYRGFSAWDDVNAVRELCSRLLNRVTDRLRPRVQPIPRKVGAPRVDRLPLALDVAAALRAAGVPLTKARNGQLDLVLKVVFRQTEGSAPTDLMRLLVRVCDQMAAVSVETTDSQV